MEATFTTGRGRPRTACHPQTKTAQRTRHRPRALAKVVASELTAVAIDRYCRFYLSVLRLLLRSSSSILRRLPVFLLLPVIFFPASGIVLAKQADAGSASQIPVARLMTAWNVDWAFDELDSDNKPDLASTETNGSGNADGQYRVTLHLSARGNGLVLRRPLARTDGLKHQCTRCGRRSRSGLGHHHGNLLSACWNMDQRWKRQVRRDRFKPISGRHLARASGRLLKQYHERHFKSHF